MATGSMSSSAATRKACRFWCCMAARAAGAARVVLFDQRGCGRSRPQAVVEGNTTWDLVADIELIRETLGIKRFILFGGSWGATLALVYAISHPARVAHLVLRGVFLMTRAELDWFYGGGAGAFFPDLWAQFQAPIPVEERNDLIGAYHRRLFSGNLTEESRLGLVKLGKRAGLGRP
jgi:proline iminopeptidase